MDEDLSYLNLLKKLDEKEKKVKIVYKELSKIYSSKEIGKQKKYYEILDEWHAIARKFLTLHVYYSLPLSV